MDQLNEHARKTTAAYLERKAVILSAAGEVFYEKGYHAASMQDVADQAGMLKAGLYYYYRSKEDLLFELVAGETVRAFINELAARDEALRDQDMPTRLRAFITQWIAGIHPRPADIAAEREYRHLSHERLEDVIALRRRVQALLQGILERGVEEGSMDSALAIPVAVMNISIMLSSVHTWYQPTGPCTLEELADWHVTFILNGLGVRNQQLP